MAREIFLSVIVPVYNAEKYLWDCYRSIAGQLGEEMEILLIDDGSPDGSLRVCEEIARQDERVRVIALGENIGVCAARNRGIMESSGRYITFVDSDDALSEGAYQEAAAAIARCQEPDVVIFGAREVYYTADGQIKGEKPIIPEAADCRTAQEVHARIAEIDRLTLYGYVWNKVYKKSVINANHLQFDTRYAIQEDFLFNADFFDCVESMAVLDRDFYRYSKRPSGSATGSFIPDYYAVHMMRVERLADQLEGWNVLDAAAQRHLARTYTRYVFSAFARNMDPRSGMDAGARKAFMRQVFESPLYARVMPWAACSGGMFGPLERALKLKNASLCAAAAAAIHRVRGI